MRFLRLQTSVSQELQGLEALEHQMGRNLEALRERRETARFNRTFKGRVFNIMGRIFTVYCIMRVISVRVFYFILFIFAVNTYPLNSRFITCCSLRVVPLRQQRTPTLLRTCWHIFSLAFIPRVRSKWKTLRHLPGSSASCLSVSSS